jgi:hypothetical protein
MWPVATRWMGDGPRAVNPHRVTYVRNPLMDDPKSGLVGDRAYWLSRIDSRDGRLGTIDVVSLGQGVAGVSPPAVQREAGVSSGTFAPINPYTREFRRRPAPVAARPEDALEVKAQNIRSVTIDPRRAGVSCAAGLRVTTDGPLTVTLLGCGRSERFDSAGPAAPAPERPAVPGIPNVPGNPLRGVPLPPEVGNAPQPPVVGLPPLRFPPNEG